MSAKNKTKKTPISPSSPPHSPAHTDNHKYMHGLLNLSICAHGEQKSADRHINCQVKAKKKARRKIPPQPQTAPHIHTQGEGEKKSEAERNDRTSKRGESGVAINSSMLPEKGDWKDRAFEFKNRLQKC